METEHEIKEEIKMEVNEEKNEVVEENNDASTELEAGECSDGEIIDDDMTEEPAAVEEECTTDLPSGSEEGEIADVADQKEDVENIDHKKERKVKKELKKKEREKEKDKEKSRTKHSKSRSRKRSRSRSPTRSVKKSRSPSPAPSSRLESSSATSLLRDVNPKVNGRRYQEKKCVDENFTNPQALQNRCKQIIQIGENQASLISDEELRNYIKEVKVLNNAIEKLQEKREIMKNELKEMGTIELNWIKEIHEELPAHMQNVLRFEGNTVSIVHERGTDGRIPIFSLAGMPGLMNIPPPIGKFPPPGMPPLPFPPPMGPNGILQPPPNFPNSFVQPPPMSIPPPSLSATSLKSQENAEKPPTLPSMNFPPPPVPDFTRPPPSAPLPPAPIPPISSDSNSSIEIKNEPSQFTAVSADPKDMSNISKNLTSILTNALKVRISHVQKPGSPFNKATASVSATSVATPASTVSTPVTQSKSMPSLMSIRVSGGGQNNRTPTGSRGALDEE